jgi:hypothetical protein
MQADRFLPYIDGSDIPYFKLHHDMGCAIGEGSCYKDSLLDIFMGCSRRDKILDTTNARYAAHASVASDPFWKRVKERDLGSIQKLFVLDAENITDDYYSSLLDWRGDIKKRYIYILLCMCVFLRCVSGYIHKTHFF